MRRGPHFFLPSRRQAAGLACAVAMSLALAGCPRSVARRPAATPLIEPAGSGGDARAAPAAASDVRTDPTAARPRITLAPADIVLQVLNANLDEDPVEEQVIAVKQKEDVDSPVRIIVVDSDTAGGGYSYPSGESATFATSLRVFSLSLKDLLGDHTLQIVVSGMNRDGKLTLDVFRMMPSSRAKSLTFTPIFQLVADEIRIEERERDEGYATGGKPGASFPIAAYLRDPESKNVMDLLKILYAWKPQEGRYVPAPPEKIPGEKVEQTQMEKLFTSTTAGAFEEYLSGLWVQVQPDPTGAGKDRILSIVDFDPRSRRISISSGDTQEVYTWKDSLRTIYNRLFAIGENEVVRQITRTFSVTAESLNTLTLVVQGSDPGDNPSRRYVKVTEDVQARLLSASGSRVGTSTISLQGAYAGAGSVEIDFSASRLVWTARGVRRNAIYALFTLGGRNILDVRFLDTGGTTPESVSWLLTYTESRNPTRITRAVTLSPVNLTVKGYEDAVGETLTLVQFEQLKK